jgi:hypothetical protein
MKLYVVHTEDQNTLLGNDLNQLLAQAKENDQVVINIDEWVSLDESNN